MYSKTITYVDFNDTERTETFYFHLSKPELIELVYDKQLNSLTSESSGMEAIESFKHILLKAYGVKSDDGRRFIKNSELRHEFEQTEAFSVIFSQLAFDADEAQKFVKGIIPGEMVPLLDKVDTEDMKPEDIVRAMAEQTKK